MRRVLPALALLAAACAGAPPRPAGQDLVTLTVIGTNDLHGHLRELPLLAGYLANLRRARPGAVVLLDGGDLFQGTLESNLAEGSPVVSAYEALGYDAVAIGNHEFDYGPAGERATPAKPTDDPRGALRARIAEAGFPFLAANLTLASSGKPLGIGELPVKVLERQGVRIGLVGVTTEQTLTTTIRANVADLRVEPLALSIARRAARLRREERCQLVIVLAHAGGSCSDTSNPRDLSRCELDSEIFQVAAALPPGAVDAIVAGHTHRTVAHFVNGIPILESWAYGRGFGRLDLSFDRRARSVTDVKVHAPQSLCAERPEPGSDPSACRRGAYEGSPVVADAAIAALIAPALAGAEEAKNRPLGVRLETAIQRGSGESALGNLFTDLMLAARPAADVALYNGGGLRADLPAGPLVYGSFYEALPFDNSFASLRLPASALREILVANAAGPGAFLSVAGVRASGRCEGGRLVFALARQNGAPIQDDERLTFVVSDFVAMGGDGIFTDRHLREGQVRFEQGEPMRETMAALLQQRGGTLRSTDLYDPARPRVALPASRPVRCGRPVQN